jgi:hypothetical protein
VSTATVHLGVVDEQATGDDFGRRRAASQLPARPLTQQVATDVMTFRLVRPLRRRLLPRLSLSLGRGFRAQHLKNDRGYTLRPRISITTITIARINTTVPIPMYIFTSCCWRGVIPTPPP